MLGYHDIRVGNIPDQRMLRFFRELAPALLDNAAPTFRKFEPLHRAYGKSELSYAAWVSEILVGSGVWPDRGSGVDEHALWESSDQSDDG